MRHRASLFVALATMLAVSALAGPVLAAPSNAGADPAAQKSFPGPGAGAKEKQRAYGRYCGAGVKGGKSRKAKERRACLDAMARLASGKASSPSAACKPLKRKHSKRRKGSNAAYKRCLKAADRLQKQQAADEQAAALHEEAEALENELDEQLAESAEQLLQDAADVPAGGGPGTGPLPDLPDLDEEPEMAPDDE